ncbi:hypothetical protein B0H14DRAFT_3427171 [Mycena olivaceomarginata]|nr:hypothetical protein B0H14DRAFT_3427171 [Mycena olivaceomarginata]
MEESGLGCAQNSDGSLREAADIQWYNDVDDERPISGPSSGASTSTAPLHPIFTNIRPLAKPSARAADPNNAESVSSGKRKARDRSPAAPKTARKVRITASDSSDSESDAPEDVDTEGDVTEGASAMDIEEYDKFKAMGDADHEHAVAKPHRTDSTADIKTVFHRHKGQKDLQTGAIIKEGGATCLVCT